MNQFYEVEHLHQPDGWLSPAFISIAADGQIASIARQRPENERPIEKIGGFVIPGLPNLHSHAFQRALAGRTEYTSDVSSDTFWTWRDLMYSFVGQLEPDDYEAIARFVYWEMIKFGITSVAEFHYVHHAPDGSRYDNQSEMSDRLISAASELGIGITILPVLYAHAGIGQPFNEHQKRFVHTDVDEYLQLFSKLRTNRTSYSGLQTGIALHSLRAVSAAELHHAVSGALDIDPNCRLHIHVSEQQKEVDEVVAGLGARPVQWLADNVGLDSRWSLIHATHIDERERQCMAASGCVAGLCPVTEASLGDGIYPLLEYQSEQGRWGVGTDSNYTTSPAEELRVLEYGLRLKTGRRNVLTSLDNATSKYSGRRLYDLALSGGAQSLGREVGALTAGKRADLVVLDPDSPSLIGHTTDTVLDAWILSATTNPVRDVMVGGRWVLRDGVHAGEDQICAQYKRTMNKLLRN